MCESRATVLGSLIGDEEDSVKEINSSLTNSLRLVPPHPLALSTRQPTPGRSASVTPTDHKNEGEPRIRLPRKNNTMCGEIGGRTLVKTTQGVGDPGCGDQVGI